MTIQRNHEAAKDDWYEVCMSLLQDREPYDYNVPHYIYIWYEKTENEEIAPFYVGMSCVLTRYTNKSSRSTTFKEYIKDREVYQMIVATGLTMHIAREVERRTKQELQKRGYKLIDAEDNMIERKRRQREEIDAMPTVNGKKISAKTGRGFGRPKAEVDFSEFSKFREEQKRGERTATECCKELGICRSTWYELCREHSKAG